MIIIVIIIIVTGINNSSNGSDNSNDGSNSSSKNSNNNKCLQDKSLTSQSSARSTTHSRNLAAAVPRLRLTKSGPAFLSGFEFRGLGFRGSGV